MIGGMKARLTVLSILIIPMVVIGSELSATRDAEIDQFLKKLNKPALKSIKIGDKDIIDCVHIKNHPIYDHHLFKNHTIQMRPSFYPEDWNNVSLNTNEPSIIQLWTMKGKCPKNSIPIRRTQKEDILRVGSIEKYRKKYPYNVPQPQQKNNTEKHEYAQVHGIGKFSGARARINVWKPYVKQNDFSLAQIWVTAQARNFGRNAVEAGWQVYPNRYGDFNPRYFIYWTADGYEDSGCYNLDCPGFVLVNKDFALGMPVKDISILGGHQYDIPTTIWRDPRSGHWWLKFSKRVLIGYWPAKIFNLLQNGANNIQFGGEVYHNDKLQHTETNMGSGRFAQEGYQKASFFRNVEIINQKELPQQLENAYIYMTNQNCYNVSLGNHLSWGTVFFYGGSGRQNPMCK